MGRHLQSCIEWLEFRSPLLKSMAPHGVRLSVEHDAVYAVYLQAGNVQPERRYSSVIVFGLACIERIPVRSGRWQFWGHFLPHRVVDLQAVFSLDVEVSRDLRAFGDIQCLHTRSLVEQNHIELAFTALHRGIENSVQRRIRISPEEVSDCLLSISFAAWAFVQTKSLCNLGILMRPESMSVKRCSYFFVWFSGCSIFSHLALRFSRPHST